MKPLITKLLNRLGQTLPEDADDAAITAALETALPLLDDPENAANSSSTAAAAAEIARLRAELETHAKTRRDDELETAINEGRITRASRDQWDRNLQADFEGNRKLLRSLKPAWNTSTRNGNGHSHSGAPDVKSLGARRGQLPAGSDVNRVQAIAEAVARKQSTANLTDYDSAFRAVRKENPELFES